MSLVKEIIEELQKNYKDTDSIIIAWWDKETMEACCDEVLTDDEWSQISNFAIDTEYLIEDVTGQVNNFLDRTRENTDDTELWEA